MRKRWTAKTEITDSLIQFREKRKWQIALRRYVLEKKAGSSSYAPYFGLDVNSFRQWIEVQFDGTLNWENFSEAWQFDHIIPVAYFDFTNEADLKLCWNFSNIRVEKLSTDTDGEDNQIDVLGARLYFQTLYQNTGYSFCTAMVEKIKLIELNQVQRIGKMESFIKDNKPFLDSSASFTSYEFSKLNEGISLTEVLAEKELFKKFGG